MKPNQAFHNLNDQLPV